MDWSGVDYLWIIVMFLSAVWTLILTAPIHISPDLMKKQTWMAWGRIHSKQIFIFGWTIPCIKYTFIFCSTLFNCTYMHHVFDYMAIQVNQALNVQK